MTAVEWSDRTCNDCGSDLLINNPYQTFGCRECENAWPMERLDDWGDASQMPPADDYSDYFDG